MDGSNHRKTTGSHLPPATKTRHPAPKNALLIDSNQFHPPNTYSLSIKSFTVRSDYVTKFE